MKKTITISTICLLLLAASSMHGQTLIARWTFPTGTAADSIADGGLPENLNKAIRTEGGTSAIDFTKNGFTTKSAQATGWDNGAGSKCWVVSFSTMAYEQIKLSSKQQSGGNNPGPRDYKVQYRIGATGAWEDVPGTTIITANDWTTGVLDTVELPGMCSSQSLVFLRWIMTTNTNSTGGTVASNGIDKIDDIYLTGDLFIGQDELKTPVPFTVTPNPSDGPVTISSREMISVVDLLDMDGRVVQSIREVNNSRVILQAGSLPKGFYFIRLRDHSGNTVTRQLMIK